MVCASSKRHKRKHLSHKINATSYLLDLLVDNDADSMLGYVVDTSRLAMVALVRHSFLNGTCALERNHITQSQCIIWHQLSPLFTISHHSMEPVSVSFPPY